MNSKLIKLFICLFLALTLLASCSNEPEQEKLKHKVYYKDTGEYLDYVESVEIPSLGLHDCFYFYQGVRGNIDCDWSTKTEPYTIPQR